MCDNYKENIIYPLNDFLMMNIGKKIGLAIGHGRMHNQKILSNINNIDAWYTLDINMDNIPDFVCDVTDKNLTAYFPDNTFDCILSAYIPIGSLHKKYFRTLNNLKRILKKNGQFITTEFPRLHFWFLPKKQLLCLVNKIIKYIESFCNYKHNFNKFIRAYNHNQLFGLSPHMQIYWIVNCFCYEHHSSFIKKTEYNYVRQLFRKNGFVVSKKEDDYLYWYGSNLR